MRFQYFYEHHSQQYTFYRIPKALFTDKHFACLSTDAKLLYGLLLDRMELSMKNGWTDQHGRVFIYFTVAEVQRKLNCASAKAVKLFKELDTPDGIGLIKSVRQGLGQPKKIFVKSFI